MVAGAATRFRKAFRDRKKCQQESKGEEAPLFGLWRAYWDNNRAKQCTCRNWHVKLDRRRPCLLVRTTQNNGQNSKTVVEDCEAEWRANQEAMMKRDMTEDSYVEQCSVKDDVPAIPSKPKPSDAPSAAPK